MEKKYKIISPAIFSLLCLLVIEIIHAADIVAQDSKGNFQMISNTLLFIIGIYGLFSAVFQTNIFKNSTLIPFLSNALVVMCSYMLNIDVFENKIHQLSDLWKGWHIMWLIWSLVLIVLFSNIGKNSYELVRSISRYLISSIRVFKDWIENTIRNSHKDVIFWVVIGMIFWIVIGMLFWVCFILIRFINGNILIEQFSKRSLVFWRVWFMIITIITLAFYLILQVGTVIKKFHTGKLLNYFIGALFLILSALQVLPLLFQVLGTLFAYLLILLLLIAALFYTGKRVLTKLKSVYWIDLCVVLAIILLTFILLPVLGASTQEGGNVLASDQIEDLTKYIELFTAGLELIKTFF